MLSRGAGRARGGRGGAPPPLPSGGLGGVAPAGLLARWLVAVLEVLLLLDFLAHYCDSEKKDKLDQIRTFSNIDGKRTC